MKPHHWPWTFIAFTALGIICLMAGVAALTGMLKGIHPLFNDDMAGWALIVSAAACFLTELFHSSCVALLNARAPEVWLMGDKDPK